jgi:hypothetical protein
MLSKSWHPELTVTAEALATYLPLTDDRDVVVGTVAEAEEADHLDVVTDPDADMAEATIDPQLMRPQRV